MQTLTCPDYLQDTMEDDQQPLLPAPADQHLLFKSLNVPAQTALQQLQLQYPIEDGLIAESGQRTTSLNDVAYNGAYKIKNYEDILDPPIGSLLLPYDFFPELIRDAPFIACKHLPPNFTQEDVFNMVELQKGISSAVKDRADGFLFRKLMNAVRVQKITYKGRLPTSWGDVCRHYRHELTEDSLPKFFEILYGLWRDPTMMPRIVYSIMVNLKLWPARQMVANNTRKKEAHYLQTRPRCV